MKEPGRWRPPPLWRFALAISGTVVGTVCRLRVTGDVPDGRRDGPLILAANHIGAFDPCVLTAACARRRLAPRILATGGLFRAPLVGAAMRASGHLRVDRRRPTVADALPVARDRAGLPGGSHHAGSGHVAGARQDRPGPARDHDPGAGDPGRPVGRSPGAALGHTARHDPSARVVARTSPGHSRTFRSARPPRRPRSKRARYPDRHRSDHRRDHRRASIAAPR